MQGFESLKSPSKASTHDSSTGWHDKVAWTRSLMEMHEAGHALAAYPRNCLCTWPIPAECINPTLRISTCHQQGGN
jgi:hypothetical protein